MNRTELQHNLGMTVALISAGMLFTTLFMGYAVYRTSAAAWPPVGVDPVSLLLPACSTALIALSSWFCLATRRSVQGGDVPKASTHLNLTLATGVGFMLSQGLLWAHLDATGLYVSSGVFASILYAFTWIHAAHVLLGLGALVYLRIVLKPATPRLAQKAINVEKLWHFLGLVWAVMFVVLFVV